MMTDSEKLDALYKWMLSQTAVAKPDKTKLPFEVAECALRWYELAGLRGAQD